MLHLLLILIFFVFAFVRLLGIVRVVRKQMIFSEKIPGPKGLPIIGNLLDVVSTSEAMLESEVSRGNLYAAQGVSRFWVFNRCLITPNCGRTIKAILDSNVEIVKGNTYAVFIPWLGNGLLLSTGDYWRQHRRLLTPTFHFSQLDTYITAMNRNAKVLVDEIMPDIESGNTIDMFPLIKRCSLDIICETIMGKDLSSQRNPDQPYVTAIQRMMRLGVDFIITPTYWFKTVRQLVGKQQEFERHAGVARTFTREVIEERSRAISNGEVESNNRTFLDLLLMSNNENMMTHDEIQDEVENFMFAGHDTTTSGITWTIWALACHPEIQERVAREVIELFGDNIDEPVTRECLTSMTYLDRCIKESLRLFPPVPLVMRTLQNDLHCGDYDLPKGALISVSPMVIHRNETIYENALKYDPDRFLPENSMTRHSHDYIPFSAGPRNCIGQRFALYELKIVMAWLIRRYRFEATMGLHENQPLSEIILRPRYGCPVRVHKR